MNKKTEFITSLLSEAGYGGFIHNFKNYILRQDEKYYIKSRKQIDNIIELLEDEIRNTRNTAEVVPLKNILSTFSEYRYKLALAKDHIETGEIHAAELGSWLKVSDIDAIESQKQLLLSLQSSIDQRLSSTLLKTFIFVMLFVFAISIILYLYFVEIVQLEYQDKFLNLILNNIPDYIFVKDKDFRIQFANENFINMHPEPMHDKIIGYTTIEEYAQEEAESFLAQDKLAFQNGISQATEKVTLPDGKACTLSTKKVRFPGIEKEPMILGISRDISELEKTIQQLELANDELTQFAYRTSHDLKAPISTIAGLTRFIKMDIEEKQFNEALSNLDKVHAETDKLLNLITDILNLSRADRDFNENYEPVCLYELIGELCGKHSNLINNKKVTVENEIDQSLTVITVKVRMYQIMENLLTNAVKYSDPNKEQPYVRISCNKKPGTIELLVEDNGLGIPMAAQDKLFTLFTRFHPDAADGSGMGLAILKKHLSRLEGSIKLNSSEKGTLFSLIFPQQDNHS